MQLRMLIEDLRPEEREIARRAAAMGIDLSVERLNQLRWPAVNTCSEPSTVLIRIPSFYHRVQASAMLEYAGHAVYNASWQLGTFGQKAVACVWFDRHQLPGIPTFACFNVASAVESARLLRYPVIVKPSIGGFGRLVHWIETERELIQAYEYLDAYAPKTLSTRVVQKALDVRTDIRVVILDGRVIAVMERVLPGAKARNISRGGMGRRHELTVKEAEVVSRVSTTVGRGFFGVDILTDQNGKPYLCEVNAVCQFTETARVCGTDIAGELLSTLMEHNDPGNDKRLGHMDATTARNDLWPELG